MKKDFLERVVIIIMVISSITAANLIYFSSPATEVMIISYAILIVFYIVIKNLKAKKNKIFIKEN